LRLVALRPEKSLWAHYVNNQMKKNMPKQISSKITALTFGVLVVLFAVAFYVVAWQEPTQAPPGGNVAAPLNISNIGQSKAGGLILNTGGAPNGLIIQSGNVGIGTASPTQKLDVSGNIKASNFPPGTCAVGSSIRAINADGTVICEADDVGTPAPVSTGLYGQCLEGESCSAYAPATLYSYYGYCRCTCPSGYTLVKTGETSVSPASGTESTRVIGTYYACYKQ